MKRILFILIVVVAAALGGVIGSIFTFRYIGDSSASYSSIDERQQSMLTNYSPDTSYRVPKGLDFLAAARQVTASVVHIRTAYGSGSFSANPLQFYLDTPTRSSGSGVIVTDDGYIVTNNHVIEDATNIEVVLNDNRRYYAKIVGTDPSTDLALLKVHGQELPFVKYGNSDSLMPGEWVLAIGNPFDLNSTVTAGIVSAKARNIGILRDRNNLQIESFIQTDAAVNPGNSGGALINLRGELIGINTAIATSTGSYQGYSFAIPVSLVKKVIDDLLEFGSTQRGLLGIQIQDVSAHIAEQLKLNTTQGVLVTDLANGSAAQDAGIVSGDVIIGIEDHRITSVSELQEWVARHRPGHEIKVTYLRDGEIHETKARLKSYQGTEEMVRKPVNYEIEGATFEDVPYKELNSLQLEGGARIRHLDAGKWEHAGVQEGFIVAYVDKIPVENVEDLNRILAFKSGGILVEGYDKAGKRDVIGVQW